MSLLSNAPTAPWRGRVELAPAVATLRGKIFSRRVRPTLFAGLSTHVDLKLVSRLEFGSGAVAMRYEPRT
jgi:hypothetical protein